MVAHRLGRLVADALAAREKGFTGSKIKIGRSNVWEDYRLRRPTHGFVVESLEISSQANENVLVCEHVYLVERREAAAAG